MMLRSTIYALAMSLSLVACEGPDGPQGPAGPAGMDGLNGDNGEDGSNGSNGSNGSDGANGADGMDATAQTIFLVPGGRYVSSADFDTSAAEITAFDPSTDRVFVINAEDATVDVLDASNVDLLSFIDSIDATAIGNGAQSVAVRDGVAAVAIDRDGNTGLVAFYDTTSLKLLSQVEVGHLPDMVTFTPDGTKVLVANEGEPSDDVKTNPEGSVSIIDVSGGAAAVSATDVTSVTFTDFNVGGAKEDLFDSRIRQIFPGVTRAVDVEPEYIAVAPDGATAWVVLQEHNALAVLDIASAEFDAVVYLGEKNHRIPGNEMDASNRDGGVNFQSWPVFGLYQPDGIATYEAANGQTYIVSANEGDAVDYDGFSEDARMDDLELDPKAFPDAATLQLEENLGRLKTPLTLGETGVTKLYSHGGRSFSIWSDTGELVFDSGNQFEVLTAIRLGDDFNASNDENGGDNRSDDKGPEPEGVALGQIGTRTYAFIGLERVGGIMVYDITNPESPSFVQYANNRDYTADAKTFESGAAGDSGPEGLTFVSEADSPSGEPLLIVGNEVTGSTTIWKIVVTQ